MNWSISAITALLLSIGGAAFYLAAPNDNDRSLSLKDTVVQENAALLKADSSKHTAVVEVSNQVLPSPHHQVSKYSAQSSAPVIREKGGGVKSLSGDNRLAVLPSNSFSSPRQQREIQVADDGELAFLQLVYDQALREDPALAAEVAEKIHQLGSEEDSVEDTSAEPPVVAGQSVDDSSLDSSDSPTDEDFEWCKNRQPAVPGKFRCPCPSDPWYRPDWRDFYNPKIPEGAGC